MYGRPKDTREVSCYQLPAGLPFGSPGVYPTSLPSLWGITLRRVSIGTTPPTLGGTPTDFGRVVILWVYPPPFEGLLC